jgi:hypothetical protein
MGSTILLHWEAMILHASPENVYIVHLDKHYIPMFIFII